MFRSPATALTLVAVAGLLFASGCSSSTASTASQPASAEAPAAGSGQEHAGHGGGHAAGQLTLFAVQTAPLGTVATDGLGRLLYRYDKDTSTPPTSTCVNECAQTWEPVLVEAGQDPELAGVPGRLVGRLARPDGTEQLTLNGWPLYTNHDDDGELRNAGVNGADGVWFAVTPTGEKAGAPAPK